MELIGLLPQLIKNLEQGGIIAFLLLACVVLVMEIRRGRRHLHDYRNELAKTYRQRDKARLAYALYRQACDQAKIIVHLEPYKDLFDDKGELLLEEKKEGILS